jgi:hypothetical protein
MVEPGQSAAASSLCNLSAMKKVGGEQQHNVLFPDFTTCLKNTNPLKEINPQAAISFTKLQRCFMKINRLYNSETGFGPSGDFLD